MTAAPTLLPGLAKPVHDTQQAFRALLDAMARPGTPHTLPAPEAIPDGWSAALTTLALTLFDQDTPVWLDARSATPAAAAHLRFHCGCPILAKPDRAAFAIIADPAAAPPLAAFPIGEPQYPDHSATLILAIQDFAGGPPLRWSGPGIKGAVAVAPRGLPPDFVAQWADNHALYPSGVDVFLAADNQILGLPRGIAIVEV